MKVHEQLLTHVSLFLVQLVLSTLHSLNTSVEFRYDVLESYDFSAQYDSVETSAPLRLQYILYF